MSDLSPGLKLSAYFLGRRIAGQRKRAPVAYLFNGVRLAPIPSHDSAIYPYLMISYDNYVGGEVKSYYAWVTTKPWKKGFLNFVTSEASSGYCYGYDSGTDSWKFGEKWEDDAPFFSPHNPIWANHNVMNSDGTTYLSASDPIPVYE